MNDLSKAVDKYKDLILETERYIWKHPETGYREFNTSRYLERRFESLGYSLTKAKDIPGFFTIVDTKKKGPEILILGELDSIICPEHKESDKDTGYIHACGHNVQAATLLGIAAALCEPEVLNKLCGKIRLCAVPAEELIEIDFRNELKEKGVIKYLTGKAEFLHRGYFDGVDIAFMVHASEKFSVIKGYSGCVVKTAHYKGLSAHAGGAPWQGINALYGATVGISATNALRETFAESELIRFHPIITHGGEAVNAIPELVSLQSFVRGVDFEAITTANKKINRALCAGAVAMGANIDINDSHGYAPLNNDESMIELAKEAADMAIPEEEFVVSDFVSSGSTDMGELCNLMPVVHPFSAGITGKTHGPDYCVAEPERACIKSAKFQLGMLLLLLQNNAERAKKIISDFTPAFASREDYLNYIDSLNQNGERIKYDDGKIEIINV